MILCEELIEKIVVYKILNGKKWSEIVDFVGQLKEWMIVVLFGQILFIKEQVEVVGVVIGINFFEEEIVQFMMVFYCGLLLSLVLIDLLVYCFYEIVMIYGIMMKGLIEEEFGDGIMLVIDFEMDISCVLDLKGDWVKVIMLGKFFFYKIYQV